MREPQYERGREGKVQTEDELHSIFSDAGWEDGIRPGSVELLWVIMRN